MTLFVSLSVLYAQTYTDIDNKHYTREYAISLMRRFVSTANATNIITETSVCAGAVYLVNHKCVEDVNTNVKHK